MSYILGGSAKRRDMKYNDFKNLLKGGIQAVYVDEKNLVVTFLGRDELRNSLHWRLFQPWQISLKSFDQLTYFKIHTAENGWSDEILIPRRFRYLFGNRNYWDKPSLALRNDVVFGRGNQIFILFNKLQLIKKWIKPTTIFRLYPSLIGFSCQTKRIRSFPPHLSLQPKI